MDDSGRKGAMGKNMGGRWGPRLDSSTSGQGTGIKGVIVA